MENKTKKALAFASDPDCLKRTADLCLIGGFASIGLSILAWGFRRATANEGHAERLGIFIGMWAPTFFILSDRLEKYADLAREGVPPLAIAPSQPEETSMAESS